MEVPHPFVETAVVGIHVVDVTVWRFWLWQARGRRSCCRRRDTVEHRLFIVRIDSQQGKDSHPYATFGPAALSAMGIVPVAKALEKGREGIPARYRCITASTNRRLFAAVAPTEPTRPGYLFLIKSLRSSRSSWGRIGSAFVEADTS
jgi:hypothetical protein